MKAKKKPNSLVPWECVILAIDPGADSGIAIYKNGILEASGKQPTYAALGTLQAWCQHARRLALRGWHIGAKEIPLIVVIESHVIHGRWSASAMAGLAEHTGAWKACIAELPRMRWKVKVLRVPVDEWRKGIYGHCRSKAPRFRKNDRHVEYDTGQYWKEMAVGATGVEDHNEAEAILIGRYASKWWKVGEQAGVKRMRIRREDKRRAVTNA